jgi:hypothetical protein
MIDAKVISLRYTHSGATNRKNKYVFLKLKGTG